MKDEVCELWSGGPRFVQGPSFALGTDSVLLGDFARPGRAETGIDLGCGSGILTLLLLEKSDRLHMTGLEINPRAADAARENLALNGWEERAGIVTGDIRDASALFRAGAFALAIANPPYFPAGSGARSPDPERCAARSEETLSLDELCEAAERLLRTGGRFFLVHRCERLGEVFVSLAGHGMEPKRLRLVQSGIESAPGLCLIEARRGAAPGLVIEPPLLLRGPDGAESEEIRRIYHR